MTYITDPLIFTDLVISDHRKRLLLTLPIASAIACFSAIFTSQLMQARLLCCFSITSLTCTAYILMFVPNVRFKPRSGGLAKNQPEPGPRLLHQLMSPLNGGLSILILLNAFTIKGQDGVHEGFWLLCTLPACKSTAR